MSYRIIEGDALERVRELEPASIQTCITSPPYWGLRDYGTGEWEGGEPDCDHIKGQSRRGINLAQSVHSTRGGAKKAAKVPDIPFTGVCGKCGAVSIDSQLGLEATPEEYVERLVEVFREVRRVLRDDGTLWLNLGDSYNAYNGNRGASPSISGSNSAKHPEHSRGLTAPALKQKDLVGIPWMVAFALRADGWYLRSDIIWAKPNPMPESVTDRPTKSHEYLFLLSKSPRYFYDAKAIREEAPERVVKMPDGWDTGEGGHGTIHRNGREKGRAANAVISGRNKRSVWSVTTQPFPDAHFATFPLKLIEPCILAGSPKGAIILDPFAGAGTTGVVALRHDREFIGVELNPEYAQMARNRIHDDAPLLNVESAGASVTIPT